MMLSNRKDRSYRYAASKQEKVLTDGFVLQAAKVLCPEARDLTHLYEYRPGGSRQLAYRLYMTDREQFLCFELQEENLPGFSVRVTPHSCDEAFEMLMQWGVKKIEFPAHVAS